MMNVKENLLALFLLLFAFATSSCDGALGDEPMIDHPASQEDSTQLLPDTLRLLAIGNSFTGDALAFLPFILQQVSPVTHVVVGILYRGGASLSWQLSAFRNNLSYYAYYKWTPERGVWFQQDFSQPLQALNDECWDYVTLQQSSVNSANFATISPYLQPMIDQLHDRGYSGKIAWIITPAYPDGSSNLAALQVDGVPLSSSDEMFQAICHCAWQVMQNPNIDLVLPCGTALQNARHTTLNNYGSFAGMSSDGLHLQSGIPMFVESCAAAMALLGCTFTQCHVDTQPAMYQLLSHGRQQGMSDDNQDLAVSCATKAYNSPFAVSQ